MEAKAMTQGTMTPTDDRNRYPQFGPLVRIWRLLDAADVANAIADGQPPEAARLMVGATRNRWERCVCLERAADHGFEPVIGWPNASGICGISVKSLRLAESRGLEVPVYRAGRQLGRTPSVVFPLCQLVRWCEVRLGWARREGW
jgi:hypothetical protein